ncbi:hypothetical protein QWE_16028 [Agrobacterium albertimagni AOL15]|uniref:Uncharacterized protein n=1 Tax=Agrobacterium albertimagni AOL15 TaxID=1156935 RepID=K2QAP8_9HYPH|nr:hypothetical protein QWE_16028 [Agrobacterium albertimagni AOL15]
MASERAHMCCPSLRQLDDSIIEVQLREIAEMKALIADLKANPTPDDAPDTVLRPQPAASQP